MAGLLIVPGLWPVFDSNGDPVAGATINFYQPNTTTPKPVYSDATLSTSLGTSLTTNAAGEPTTLAGAVARLWWAGDLVAFDVQVIAGASTRTWSNVLATNNEFSIALASDPLGSQLASIATLRAVVWTGTRPAQIRLVTNYAAGDGGGFFYWDATSTATDNGGTIIKETATATGRWIRLEEGGPIQVSWFGQDSAAWTAATALAASRGLNVGVIQSLPGNNVISTSPTYLANIGVLSYLPRFSGAGNKAWAGDQALYGDASKPSNAWLSLEGRVDRGSTGEDVTQVGFFTSLWVEQTNSTAAYLKMAHYVRAYSEDPTAVGIDRDVVAGGFFGRALGTNGGTKRVWAGYFDVQIDSDADALATGIEIDCFNYGPTQDGISQTNSKYGMRIFASKGPFTAAMLIDFSPFGVNPNLNRFHHGIYINPTAIETDGYAFRLGSLGAWLPSGALTIGSDTLRAGYTATFSSSGNTNVGIIASGSGNDGVISWIWPLNTAWAMGLDNASGQLQIASGENLSTPKFGFTAAGALGVGGAVPSLGSATNGVFILRGITPTVAPANGFFLYVDLNDSNKLKAMNPNGVVTTLAL